MIRIKGKGLYTASLLMLSVLLLSIAGCGMGKKAPAEKISNYGNKKVVISGLKDENFEVSVSQLMQLETVTKSAKANTSNGQEVRVKITGPLLDTFLKQYGKSQKDFSTIRLTAKDKYSIAVPKDILSSREIILGVINKGEALTNEDQPVKVVIPGERAMYWVRMLSRIDFETGGSASLCKKIVFLDTAVRHLPQEDYQYYESKDKAVKTRDLIGKYADINNAAVKDVYMTAGDGLNKNETVSNFLSGYIKFTGKDIPGFLSPDLPQGMHIRDLLTIHYGDTAFFSVCEAKKTFPKTTGTEESVAYTDIAKETGTINAKNCTLIAADGSKVTLAFSKLANGGFSLGSDGAVAFDSGAPNHQKISGLLEIELTE